MDATEADQSRSVRVRQAVRYRHWPTQSGRTVDATDVGGHVTTRNGEVHQSVCRAKISTMLIAALQCGRAKVDGTSAFGIAVDAFGRGRDDVQQFACVGEMLAAAGVGKQAVMADAVEAAGQDVQQEA